MFIIVEIIAGLLFSLGFCFWLVFPSHQIIVDPTIEDDRYQFVRAGERSGGPHRIGDEGANQSMELDDVDTDSEGSVYEEDFEPNPSRGETDDEMDDGNFVDEDMED